MAGASAAEQLEAVAERRLKRWLRAGGGAGLALAALLGVLVGLLPALLVAFLSTTAALGALLGLARRQKGRAEARARLAGERLQAALEEERAHLARELHDELGQYLTVMAMDLSRLEESLAEQDPARERVEALAAALQHCLARLRRLAWELAPRSLDLGLPAALEWEARRLGRRTGVDVQVFCRLAGQPLAPECAEALFRVAQEALTNALRHARPRRLDVRLWVESSELRLEVRDDGRGIEEDQVRAPFSRGLAGMRERLAPWGGRLEVEGQPGRGTRVSVAVPLERAREGLPAARAAPPREAGGLPGGGRSWRLPALPPPRWTDRLLALLALLLGLYALWPWLPGAEARPRTLVVYGFSILGEVIQKGVFPAFREHWRQRTGQEVELVSSFAGSGTVTNQILLGVPAQIAMLALEPDATRLAQGGVVPEESWRRLPHGGVLNRTPFIILVRPGNPKGIRDFEDLTRPGIRIVHPDPLTSGGAQWSILAEYGAGVRQNPGDPGAGLRLLLGLWRNVSAQSSSARGALTQFENGFGDALVTYEQDVVRDLGRGRLQGEIVYPHSTILSEHVLVPIDRNISAPDRALVDEFVAFLWSRQAQSLFVQYGFRSVWPGLDAANPNLKPIADPFTVGDLGGWAWARAHIVEGVWKERVLAELHR